MKISETPYYQPIDYFVADRQNQFKVVSDTSEQKRKPFANLLRQSLTSISFDECDVVIHHDQIQKLVKCTDFSFVQFSKTKHQFYEAELCYFDPKSEIFVTLSQDLSSDYEVELFEHEMYRVETLFYDNRKPNVKVVLEQFYNDYLQNYSLGEKIAILVKESDYFELKTQKIKPLALEIEQMYNDDFVPVHEHIKQSLTDSSKGIVLLHGLAGTGKTNYIKWLISQIPDKKFIFVPTTIIHQLTDPAFISILLQNKNAVLVMEDCENYIAERHSDNAQSDVVASILNLADGILSDIVECQIICTFNASIDKIDTALLRKGRLIAEYKFDELTVDKANAYLQSIGKDEQVTKPITLADLTNFDSQNYKTVEKKKSIGFF